MEDAKEWRLKNREQHNKTVLNNYYANKEKWNVRARFNNNPKYLREIMDIKNNCCEKCSSKQNLEIHHKTYDIPNFSGFVSGLKGKDLEHRRKLMVDTIALDIMLLCRNCHKKIHLK